MATYSHSRLSCFEQCPRQYYFRYVAKVEADAEQGIEAFLGSLVHETLEKLYRDRMHGKILSAEQLVAFFDDQWDRRFHDDIVIVRRQYSARDYRNVGRECLRKYHARYCPFDQSTTLALEDRIVIALDGAGKYSLLGYIDRVSLTADGRYEIHDYKTSTHLPGRNDVEADRQLALYQIGIQRRWDDAERVDLVWHYLRHDKEIRSSRTDADLAALRKNTIRLIDDIESREEEADFETQESTLCGWCGYQPLCPLHKHRCQVDTLPAKSHRKDSGVKLVNRYADIAASIKDLRDQIAGLEEERAEIEETLLAYADNNGLEVIAGSDHEVRISQQDQIVLPRKTYEPEEYRELEAKLRRSKAWPSVSAMDMARIRAIVLGEEPDPGRIRKVVEPFVQTEQVRKIRLRRCKPDEE